jgi:hypothetical protein
MDTLYDRCIDVLSQYCIYLIQQKRFCDTRLVGRAIDAVLNSTAESKPKLGGCEVAEKALPSPSNAL